MLNTFPVLCLLIFNRELATPPSPPQQPLMQIRKRILHSSVINASVNIGAAAICFFSVIAFSNLLFFYLELEIYSVIIFLVGDGDCMFGLVFKEG